MSWVSFTLLAVFLWSLASIVDKYTISKYIKKPLVMMALYPFYSLIFALLIFFFHGITIPKPNVLILSILSGILYFLMLFFYIKSLSFEEVSRVSPLFSLNLVFVLLFCRVFLGEVFSFEKYFGIFLILSGSVLISIKKRIKIKISKALLFMIFAGVFGAVYSVVQKIVLNELNYWSAFILVRVSSVLLAPVLLPQFIHFIKIVKKAPRVFAYLSFSEISNMVALYSIIIAYSIGPMSLVATLSEVQSVVVLLIASGISIFKPKALETFKVREFLLKLISIIMITAGAVIIQE
jgi:uncharacterized membrane protein